ncbi:MAG: glycosyltransferase family 2 protein [Crocinitomicaceae bacterium]
MKVSGFTFIRNAIKLDYPIVEAIQSILPLCDEVIVALGQSEDDTLELIQSIDPSKIKIVETIWDDSLREHGAVLADETNKAFQAISSDSDWAFYIQGDEVIHEEDYEEIRAKMELYLADQEVDGLLFAYQHFYGSYDFIGASNNWYKNEIRIVRNSNEIYSYRDAQGFRKGDNQKLNVARIDARVYHYGWVKDPRAMQAKQTSFHKLWHSDEWLEKKGLKCDDIEIDEDFYIYRQVSQETLRKKGYTEYSKKILSNHVQLIIATKSNSEINSNVR